MSEELLPPPPTELDLPPGDEPKPVPIELPKPVVVPPVKMEPVPPVIQPAPPKLGADPMAAITSEPPIVMPEPVIKPPTVKQQSWGTIVSIVLIVLMIMVGAFYAWGKRIAEEQQYQNSFATGTSTTASSTAP